jgi:hypothetical protein
MNELNKKFYCLDELSDYESFHFSLSLSYITWFLTCIVLIIEYSTGLICRVFGMPCKFLQFDLCLQIFTKSDSDAM